MNFKWFWVFSCFALCIFCMMSGCTSSKNLDGSYQITPVVTPSESQVTTVPVTITAIVTTTSEIPSATETTTSKVTTPQVNSKSKVEPYVDSFKIEKNYLAYPLSNCVMKEIFPAIGNDPNYGLKASPPKLTGIAWTEWNVFIKDYTEGKNEKSKTIGISRCVNPLPVSPNNPNWNFIKISAELTPRNAQPTNYDIVFHISSNAKGDICQIKLSEILYQDQKITVETFIPMRDDELDMFNTAVVKFNE
ncbi:MAG: hypothetical protein OS112_06505 [Methanoregula sp.]|nr:MAG: hypothetical protein OS112_06505 [Methanoregula sp.]